MHAPSRPFGVLTLGALLLLPLASGGCGLEAGREAPVPPNAGEGPDALYRDFLDGKFDGAGHPIGSTVFEAEASGAGGCQAATGWPGALALAVDPAHDGPGSLCDAATPDLGRGPYVINLRAALTADCGSPDCGPALTVRVLGEDDIVLAEGAVLASDFTAPGVYQNVPLRFRMARPGPVRVEVRYHGTAALSLDYVELFRQGRQLVLSPPSGVLDAGTDLRIEVIDPPDDHVLRVRCDDTELDAPFAQLLADGAAVDERTEFRRIVTVPADILLEGCADSTQVVVSLAREGLVHETSEVHFYAEEPPCDFEGAGDMRVLVTGFVPFPAGAQQDNSSMAGVLAFDGASVPGAQVMKLILPVEFENAAALTQGAVERCAPDVVVGFGQGRGRVDLESTAYNVRDTSTVPGGVPDNRGLVVEPAPIRVGGPDVYRTELPVEAIAADLRDLDIRVAHSDEPGRYVCNDVFYSLGTQPGSEARTTGFVHMPYVRHVDEPKRAELASVVESVVRRTVEASRP